ncbi:MAG: pcpB2 [Caulobacter sp.]|nr:pcpB2 [Caulobacter sp.]
MPKDSNTDVLICGAGAAGLTLAIELARRGVDFRLIEKLDGPFRGSRGKGIQPRTQEVFEDLGIIDRVVASGGIYPPVLAYRPDGTTEWMATGDIEQPTPAEPYHMRLMSPQFLTEAAMRERLAEMGRRVEFDRELKSFKQNAECVTARIAGARGRETIRARYLVGADGGRSFVRRALGIGFPGDQLGVRFVCADVILEGLVRDTWHQFMVSGPDKWMAVAPLMGTDLFQLQGPIPLEAEIDLSVKGLQRIVAERTGRDDIVLRSVSWASTYVVGARLADTYRVGRVFLAGDAAHIHPATGAQGLNTSVQDAYNLGWKLAAVLRGTPDTLLATYEAERRPIAAEMLGLASKLLNEAAGKVVIKRGREVLQLDLSYRGSGLALERPKRAAGIAAGDRAPDAAVRGAGGLPTRLFKLFQGPHWTLLGYETDRRPPVEPRDGLRIHHVGPRGDIIDDGGQVRDAYGLSPGDWVLVRPDGYVGAIVSGAEISALDPYLASAGVAAKPSRSGAVRRAGRSGRTGSHVVRWFIAALVLAILGVAAGMIIPR